MARTSLPPLKGLDRWLGPPCPLSAKENRGHDYHDQDSLAGGWAMVESQW